MVRAGTTGSSGRTDSATRRPPSDHAAADTTSTRWPRRRRARSRSRHASTTALWDTRSAHMTTHPSPRAEPRMSATRHNPLDDMGGSPHVLSSCGVGGKVTFREFLGVLGARWRIIAVSLLAVIAAAAVQTMLTPAVYTASAKIFLSATQPAGAGTNNQVATYALSADDLARYIDVLNAPSVIEPLRDRLGLEPGTPIAVSAEVGQTSNVMTITAT